MNKSQINRSKDGVSFCGKHNMEYFDKYGCPKCIKEGNYEAEKASKETIWDRR